MREQVYSPLKGKLINIEDVSDEMFSQRMLGDGVAIIPSDKNANGVMIRTLSQP